MVLAHDALYSSQQSGVHRKRYRMGEQKVCRPQPVDEDLRYRVHKDNPWHTSCLLFPYLVWSAPLETEGSVCQRRSGTQKYVGWLKRGRNLSKSALGRSRRPSL